MSEKISLAEKTAERMIRELLESGVFKDGEKLPNELELSAQMGVSRITLREAIRILSAQGQVEVRRGIGTFVTKKARLGAEFDIIRMRDQPVNPRDLLEFRSCIEPMAAYLAAVRASEEEADHLSALAECIFSKFKKNEDTVEEEIAFHSFVARISGNDFFKQLIPVLTQAVIQAFDHVRKEKKKEEYYVVEHRQIAEAVREGNGDKAKLLMELHMMTFDQ